MKNEIVEEQMLEMLTIKNTFCKTFSHTEVYLCLYLIICTVVIVNLYFFGFLFVAFLSTYRW